MTRSMALALLLACGGPGSGGDDADDAPAPDAAVLEDGGVTPRVDAGPSDETLADSVAFQGGPIVFHFAEEYVVGQFVNGDWWVHNRGGDVVITAIDPASVDGDRVMHGTMLDPANAGSQGYDSAARDMGFEATLNVDPAFSGEDLVVSPTSSVIKGVSTESDEGRPILSDAAVLTVLAATPPRDSFRPPYVGTRAVVATAADLDYSVLGRHPRLGGEPDITDLAGRYRHVWLEHNTAWTSRDIHPANHMPAYGRDLARNSAEGLILLQLDYPDEDKEAVLIGLVQYGIDIYGIAREGGAWNANGGHNLGRKMPLLLAGTVLHHAEMLEYANAEEHFIFQDDQQHFFVSMAEVDMTHSGAWDPDERAEPTPYETSDIGLPEWGIRHHDRPQADNKNWGATYRHVNGPSQTMQVFAARLMGVVDAWAWPPVFAYTDRYVDTEGHVGPDWFGPLYDAYRGDSTP
ncbi:MAG: hypothetical protein JJ863_08750 [Deltaproteobacteria bacterium]|nr:hypothetical protein [Deltaproteobacteria bacterium]